MLPNAIVTLVTDGIENLQGSKQDQVYCEAGWKKELVKSMSGERKVLDNWTKLPFCPVWWNKWHLASSDETRLCK